MEPFMKVLVIALQNKHLARFSIQEMERPEGQEIKIGDRSAVQLFSNPHFPFKIEEFTTIIPEEFDSKTMGQFQIYI